MANINDVVAGISSYRVVVKTALEVPRTHFARPSLELPRHFLTRDCIHIADMDRYRVVKRIGVGTYGSAYLVTLKRDPSQEYVLKKIKLDEANEKERLQAETEVAVLMQLSHPLVLR